MKARTTKGNRRETIFIKLYHHINGWLPKLNGRETKCFNLITDQQIIGDKFRALFQPLFHFPSSTASITKKPFRPFRIKRP